MAYQKSGIVRVKTGPQFCRISQNLHKIFWNTAKNGEKKLALTSIKSALIIKLILKIEHQKNSIKEFLHIATCLV